MKTLILIAMLSLTACASTPLEPAYNTLESRELFLKRKNEKSQQALELSGLKSPQVATPIWDIFVRGMSRAIRVEEARRINSPAFRCYTQGRVTTCNPY
jgi:hypothetical protein